MLTIKQITDDKEAVIRGLEKKHFKGAREAIDGVLAFDNKRKEAQVELDALNAKVKTLSKSIGGLMKEGKKEEAEAAKAEGATIKVSALCSIRFLTCLTTSFPKELVLMITWS